MSSIDGVSIVRQKIEMAAINMSRDSYREFLEMVVDMCQLRIEDIDEEEEP